VPFDTAPVPYANPFVLRNWDVLERLPQTALGTDQAYKRIHRGNRPFPGPECFSGTQDQWENGCLYSDWVNGLYTNCCSPFGAVLDCCPDRLLPDTLDLAVEDVLHSLTFSGLAYLPGPVNGRVGWIGQVQYSFGACHTPIEVTLSCDPNLPSWAVVVNGMPFATTAAACGPPFRVSATGSVILCGVLTVLSISFQEAIVSVKTGTLKANAHADQGYIDDLGSGAWAPSEGGTGLAFVGADWSVLAAQGGALGYTPAVVIVSGWAGLPAIAVPPAAPPPAFAGLLPMAVSLSDSGLYCYFNHRWNKLQFVPQPFTGTIIDDAFVDPNGTALTAHVPAPINAPGSSWQIEAGSSWDIQGNKAEKVLTNAVDQVAWLEATSSDVTVTLVIDDLTEFTDLGMALRLVDAANYLLIYGLTTGTVYIAQFVAGAFSILFTGAFVPAAGPLTIKAVCAGNNIAIYVNGVLSMTHAVAQFATATKHGLYGYFTGGGQFFRRITISSP
jgi:hypothetical protein